MSFQGERLNTGPASQPVEGFPFPADSPFLQLVEPLAAGFVPYTAGLAVFSDPIAAAVEAHSKFQTQPWSRLLHTGVSAARLVYAPDEEGMAKARELFEFHKTISGTHAGVDYAANDQQQQANVWVTVQRGVFDKPWEALGRPLTQDQRSGIWAGMLVTAKRFGSDSQFLPTDIDGVDQHWHDYVHGNQILRTPVSHRMVNAVFRYSNPRQLPKWLGDFAQSLWVTSLDPHLQERAEIVPNERDLRIRKRFDKIIPNTYAYIPGREKALPAYLFARRSKALQWLADHVMKGTS